MRWEDERYVRFYTRDTPEFMALSWQARGLLGLLMRKVDRAGVLPVGKLGVRGAAVAVGGPWSEIEPILRELTEDGCVVFDEARKAILLPNFMDAQEAKQSDAARKRASREKARAEFGGSVTASEAAARLKRDNEIGLIYFAASPETGSIKIGWTERLADARVRELERAHGHPIRMLHCHPGTKPQERELHDRLRDSQIEGEWFRATPEVISVTQCDCMQSLSVTHGHAESPRVTQRPTESHSVTPSLPDPDPSRAELMPEPDDPGPALRRRISSAIRQHRVFASVDADEKAHAIEADFLKAQLAKGTRIEFVLTAIDECASKVSGANLNAESLSAKISAFVQRAGPPRTDPEPQPTVGRRMAKHHAQAAAVIDEQVKRG